MKKCFPVIVSVLCVAASVSMAQKAVPYQDTYETYAVGSNLVGSVWNGDTNTSLAVVTNVTSTAPSVGYPVPAAAHTKVMAFSEGTITNEFNGTSLTLVAIDTLIKPVFAEPPAGSQMAAVSNSQLSLYVDTNGFLNVFHGLISEGTPLEQPTTFAWATLSNGVSAITSGQWARLTVTVKYSLSGAMFKVGLNGQTLTSAQAFVNPDTEASTLGGSWFVAAKWAPGAAQLNRVVLSGSGMMDDMVVATNEISFSPGGLYATNGTSIAWMQSSGLTTNGTYPTWDDVALADQDGDGASTWAEYYAGTAPTNNTSKLVIVSATYSNGFPILKWIGTTNARAPYIIQWSSNLMSVLAWTNSPVSLTQSEGTNEVTLPTPPVTPSFLRVTVPVP